MRVPTIAAACVVLSAGLLAQPAAAEWKPPGLHATRTALADVLALNAKAQGAGNARFAHRRERWTYVNGTRHIAVAVAVNGDDFRTTLALDGVTYTAGRQHGARWRGDGNGAVHGVQADLQGDALDRAPQSLFTFDRRDCSLAGETTGDNPAWVVMNDPAGDKPHWFWIDKKSGDIVRDVTRDGRRVITTTFDGFEAVDGTRRPRHWTVRDGNAANDLDVTVEAIEPGTVSDADVSFPTRRLFAPIAPLHGGVALAATFSDSDDTIFVDGDLDGKRSRFILDTGTASITLDSAVARSFGGPVLDHASIPRVSVGPLQLADVSALTVPVAWSGAAGILGFDFFFGHVLHIDYPHKRVEVFEHADGDAMFRDPQTTVVEANVDQGLPLVRAALGPAQSDMFAIDTGSSHLYVMRPFAQRYAGEIAAHWTLTSPVVENVYYLEGGIAVRSYRVSRFSIGSAEARDLTVGVQQPSSIPDDLAIPFDGIIGTDILRNFDVWLDYDNGRIGLRR